MRVIWFRCEAEDWSRYEVEGRRWWIPRAGVDQEYPCVLHIERG